MILIVDMNNKKNSLGFYEFVLPIAFIVKETGDYIVKHYSDIEIDGKGDYDCIILSGSPLKDNATLNQLDKFKWVQTCTKPLLGICAGMQTIGLVFGSRLKKCPGIGMTKITTLNENPLFSSTFEAYTLHNYSVVPSREFEALAESPDCLQAFRHRERTVYGLLFHPEVRNPDILQRFIRSFGPHRRV